MRKFFEISNKDEKAGRVYFKQVIHKIFKDESTYNINGISWSREYTELNKESVNGMPLVCQFLDKDNQIPFGSHGNAVIKDGDVYFDDSLVVGSFENAYIVDDLEVNGELISALVGEGYIYSQRFPALVDHLREQYDNRVQIDTSAEICADKSRGYEHIVYENGYKEKGRIPKYYQYSGSAICAGTPPADASAVMLEINSAKNNTMHLDKSESNDSGFFDDKTNEEVNKPMDENMTSKLISDIKEAIIEVNSKNAEYETEVGKLKDENAVLAEANAKSEEAIASKDAEIAELNRKVSEMEAELNECKKAAKISEMNNALADYSKEQKAFVEAEIKAFETDPMSVEVNSIVDKILIGIGKQAVEAAKEFEVNSKKQEAKMEDIFGDIYEANSKSPEEVSIF